GLERQLPGVSFDEPQRSGTILISDAFNISLTPQLIFPGQRVQALARLGSKFREIVDGQVGDGHKEVFESLKSIEQVPLSLRRPNGLMRSEERRVGKECRSRW